ncbi:hypothetical protein V8G54_017371 [Vigna mungo]|uniref:Uncharacterized protein n=1 Tax=Vigna mungo TaxID=3915 RepID=A0AAQ3S207_VIGMU
MMLNVAAQGDIRRKTEDEAYDLIKLMADNEETYDAHGDDVKDASLLQANIETREQSNAVLQQLGRVANTLSDLSQTVKKVSMVPQQPQFMPIQKSAESEEIFQKIMKRSVCTVSSVENNNVEEACEIATRNGKILKEKERDQVEETVKAKEKDYEKPLPYPKAYSRKEREKQFERFMELFKKLEITIPFFEALQQIPSYAKFLKELITKMRKHLEEETIEVQGNCSAVLHRSLPPKLQDPGSFTIPCTIGELDVGKALIDLGASINLMLLSMLKKIRGVEIRPTRMVLQLANRSLKYPFGIAEDVIVKVDKFLFPVDFVIMEMEENGDAPLILGRPFMKTARIIIDVEKGKLKVQVQDEEMDFDVFQAMSHPKDNKSCFQIDVVEELCMTQSGRVCNASMLERTLIDKCEDLNEEEDKMKQECVQELKATKEIPAEQALFEKIEELPPHLKYVFFEDDGGKHVIISTSLSSKEEGKLVEVLKANKGAIGWSIADLKGISPTYCKHIILMEEDYRPVAQPQRRLNPVMKEVVRKEVLKLLEVGIIYPISDSKWVSPGQVVPKKGGITVIHNEKNELIPTVATGKSRRDDDPKKGKRFILENYGKTIKDKQGLRKPKFGFGSRLRVGKVLAPHNACPKARLKTRGAEVEDARGVSMKMEVQPDIAYPDPILFSCLQKQSGVRMENRRWRRERMWPRARPKDRGCDSKIGGATGYFADQAQGHFLDCAVAGKEIAAQWPGTKPLALNLNIRGEFCLPCMRTPPSQSPLSSSLAAARCSPKTSSVCRLPPEILPVAASSFLPSFSSLCENKIPYLWSQCYSLSGPLVMMPATTRAFPPRPASIERNTSDQRPQPSRPLKISTQTTIARPRSVRLGPPPATTITIGRFTSVNAIYSPFVLLHYLARPRVSRNHLTSPCFLLFLFSDCWIVCDSVKKESRFVYGLKNMLAKMMMASVSLRRGEDAVVSQRELSVFDGDGGKGRRSWLPLCFWCWDGFKILGCGDEDVEWRSRNGERCMGSQMDDEGIEVVVNERSRERWLWVFCQAEGWMGFWFVTEFWGEEEGNGFLMEDQFCYVEKPGFPSPRGIDDSTESSVCLLDLVGGPLMMVKFFPVMCVMRPWVSVEQTFYLFSPMMVLLAPF